ncbi:MAG: hypothetical protein ACYDG2_08980 [Ruminiclostridium sp.]
MKLERKQKTRIVLGIAALLIIYGLLDMVFKFNISQNTINNVSMVLMIIAFGLLFSGRKPKQNNSDDTQANSQLEDSTNVTQVNNQLQSTNDETTETIDQSQDADNGTETSDQSQKINND